MPSSPGQAHEAGRRHHREPLLETGLQKPAPTDLLSQTEEPEIHDSPDDKWEGGELGGPAGSAASSKVVLTDGALANNVYWQVVGAISLGAGAKYVGTLLGAAAITFGDGASIKGRALTPAAITLTNSPFTWPIDDLTAPIVTVDGGAPQSTNDPKPSISGTTDEPAGRTVTVTVGGQTLTTAVGAGGAWGVSATALTEGPHDVVASITDASQNMGSATQVLPVDVTAPVVSINGGATMSTKDTTPSISGTADAPADTAVTVTVDGQTLASTVGAGGAWSVEAATLTEAPHTVVVSVEDAAQNTGTATQTLTITGAPAARYQPDAAVRPLPGSFVGVGIYDLADQRVTKRMRAHTWRATFEVRVLNRGESTDRMEIRGTPRNNEFKVTYLAGGVDVTRAVTAGSYLTNPLAPGESAHLVIKVTRTKASGPGDRRTFEVRTGSSHSQTAQDTVAAVVWTG